ncbi:hypothetical protein ABN028_19915 [Actinopolymorpha sp. B17G11]|uniref:hypothetical protein n=1 Tax=Actinopolymorpha sp. B17G11 TaxID=3160861 RepID=UPI0032E3D657
MAGRRRKRADEDGVLPPETWVRRANRRRAAVDVDLVTARAGEPVERVTVAADFVRGLIVKATRHNRAEATAAAAEAERVLLQVGEQLSKAVIQTRRSSR